MFSSPIPFPNAPASLPRPISSPTSRPTSTPHTVNCELSTVNLFALPTLDCKLSALNPPPPQSLAAIPFRIRTYEKYVRNPFGIRTSKTKNLKLFRMNTYEKNRGWGATSAAARNRSVLGPLSHYFFTSLLSAFIFFLLFTSKRGGFFE